MKVTIISHAYMAPENQKNIHALAAFCDVQCVVPRTAWIPMYKSHLEVPDQPGPTAIKPYRTFNLSASQFVFLSRDLGFLAARPDIINVEYHPWSLVFMQVLIYRFFFCRKAKIVCTVKKNTYELRSGLIGRIKHLITRLTIGAVDHFICASRMTADLYATKLAVPEEKISICHHLAVDTALFSPTGKPSANESDDSTRRFVVGYCGRFDEEKGLRDLIEAMRLLKAVEGHKLALRLLGGGTVKKPLDAYLEKLEQEVDWLEIHPSVTHEKVPEFMRALDIFVLPARVVHDHQEHDAHALLEAMACGVACIGTQSGIIPEILDVEQGYLVAPSDPQALAMAILRLIENPAERRMLATAAREKALKEFALDVVARCRLSAFGRVLNK